MGHCPGASRIYWVCKYSRAPAVKKETVNKKEAARYAKEERAPKIANAMLEKLASPYSWTNQKRASL
jgi:hypothetical protein